MMNRKERWSGAPVYRGRLSAWLWLWFSGFFMGDIDIDVVRILLGGAPKPNHNWQLDLVLMGVSFGCMIAGMFSLNQYGRNAWFAWAPDHARWRGLHRADVNRMPVIRRFSHHGEYR